MPDSQGPLFYDSSPVHEILASFTIATIAEACQKAGIPLMKLHVRSRAALFRQISSSPESSQRALREIMLEEVSSKKRLIDVVDGAQPHLRNHGPMDDGDIGDHQPEPQRWAEDSFMRVPPPSELNKLIGNYLERTSNQSLKVTICGVCAQELEQSKTSPFKLSELPGRTLLVPSMSHPSHILTDGLLVYPDSVNQQGEIPVCRNCEHNLLNNTLPPLSLANNMWVGSIPTELALLTLPEKMLISRYFPSAYIVKLFPKKVGAHVWDENTRHSGVKGNVSSYALDTNAIADMIRGELMPQPSKILASVIGVAFVGFKQIKDRCLPPFLHVRRERVRQALLWLKRNNPLYSEIQISDERLEMLPEQGVPHEILSNTRISDDHNAMAQEHDGYVPDTQEIGAISELPDWSNITPEDDDMDVDHEPSLDNLKTSGDPDDAVIPIQSTGIVDVSGDEVPDRELLAHALHNTSYQGYRTESHNEGERYVVRKGDAFVSEYARIDLKTGQRHDGGPNNPNHLLGCFPWLFPWALGGFEVFRHTNVPYETHARWALQYGDKRFRKDMHFVFQIFGVIQKRKICSSASLQITRKSFLANQEAIRTLKPADFAQASQEEAAGIPFSNKAITALRSQLRAIRVRVPGTDESRASIRGKIWGTVLVYSPPSLWITINPSDIHDPVAQVIAGEDIDLDRFVRTAGPTSTQRAINICSDPYAAARYFHLIIHVVLETLFGIKVSHDKQRHHRTPGLAGLVQGYIGTVEAQNRGSLHLHMIMWLHGAPTSREMSEALATPEFRDRVRDFINSVIKADIDGADFAKIRSMKVVKEISYSRPPKPESDGFETVKRELERDLARAVQLHTCDRDRCLRVKNNRLVCKRRAPWPLSPVDWIGPDGSWGPRRLCAYMNNWNSLVLICLGCNNDFKMLTNSAVTRKSTWYISIYGTKKQGKDSNVSAVLAERLAFPDSHNDSDSSEKTPCGENKRLLQRCANTLTRMQQFSAPEAISYIMGWGDRFESHHYVNIYWDSAVVALKRVFPELRVKDGLQTFAMGPEKTYHKEELDTSTPGYDTGRMEFSNGSLILRDQLKDYAFRGDGLKDLSFLDFMLETYEGDIETQTQKTRNAMGLDPTTVGRHANQRVLYKPELNKQGRCRIVRSRGHETLPHFAGAWFPRNDDSHLREFYCASMLLLLTPWTDISQLKGGRTNFSERFDEFTLEAPKKVLRILDNIQYYHEAFQSGKEEKEQDADTSGDPSHTAYMFDAAGQSTNDAQMDVDGSGPELVTSVSLYSCNVTEVDVERARTDREHYRDVKWGNETILNAVKAGIFPDKASRTEFLPAASVASTDQVVLSKLWQKKLKAIVRESAKEKKEDSSTQAGKSPNHAQAVRVPLAPRDQNIPSMEPYSSPAVSSHAPQPESEEHLRSLIDQEHVNELKTDQRAAYDIIERQLLDRLLGREPEQLLMLVVGQGGTGKSKLIEAITKTFRNLGAENLLAKTASSGIAASLITGHTMHAWAGIPIKLSSLADEWAENSSQKTTKARIHNITGRQFLLHDEMSMTTKEQLACLSQCCSLIHTGTSNYHASKPFGGMDVIMFGDFHQFPPVGNSSGALYCERNRTDSHRALIGRQLYMQFRKVIVLHEQMRVKDPRWHEILQNLRTGDCTTEDIGLLHSLVLGEGDESNVPDFSTDPWNEAVLVTPRHTARRLWNQAALRKHSEVTGNKIYICPSEDTRAETGGELDIVQRYRLASMKSEKTGKLPDQVELSVGMKVMVVLNIATEADLTNGTRGRITGIVLDPREEGTLELGSAAAEVHLKYLPLIVYFQPDIPSEHRFDGLEQGIIPISPSEATFTVAVDGRDIRVRRRQLALTAGYAFTDYKSQGQTIRALVVDLAKPPTGGSLSPFSAYVTLSRSQGRATTRFIRGFEDRLFTTHPSDDLRAEDARLSKLDRETRISLGLRM